MRRLLCIALLLPLPALANMQDLLEMSDRLDQADKQDLMSTIDKANACTRTRDFACANAQIAKAAKLANGARDKQMLAAARQNMANEKARIAEEERRREEEDRQLAEAEERMQLARARAERRAREEEDDERAPSTASQLLQLGGMIAQQYQTNKAASIAANAARPQGLPLADLSGLERQYAEQRAKIAADRKAREQANTVRLAAANPPPVVSSPQYQPQRVIVPQADKVCPPGYTWYNPATGVGAKGGTCYANAAAQAQARPGTNSGADSGRSPSASAATTRPQPSPTSGETNRQDVPGPTAPGKQQPKTDWGPIQLEALAICRKGEKSGKWWCDGPVQELILFDNPTVEDALSSVGCFPSTSAAGGTTKDGKQGEVYRCGYGLRSWDRNIAKIHGLITAQRSYICPKIMQGAKCTTFYDGQDRR